VGRFSAERVEPRTLAKMAAIWYLRARETR
jgi:hypothetical protein